MAVKRAAALLSDPKIEDKLLSQPAWGTRRIEHEPNQVFITPCRIHMCVCVCVFSSSGRRELPSDLVPTARRIHPPLNACNVIPPSDTPSASPWEDVSWRVSVGDGTATTNFVGTISWSPSDIPPGATPRRHLASLSFSRLNLRAMV